MIQGKPKHFRGHIKTEPQGSRGIHVQMRVYNCEKDRQDTLVFELDRHDASALAVQLKHYLQNEIRTLTELERNITEA